MGPCDLQEKKKARSRVALQGFRHSASCHSCLCEKFPALASQASQKKKKEELAVWSVFGRVIEVLSGCTSL